MEKINILELLKDCPQGMELYCTVYNDVTFLRIDEVQNRCYFKAGPADTFWTTCEGRINGSPFGKCVIFPKGKTTWEGFIPPCKFKDGDVLFVDFSDEEEDKSYQYIFILNKPEFYGKWHSYCYLNRIGDFNSQETYLTDDEYHPRFATEEEKQMLFNAIKKHGYKWNAETKTLEKLTEQKFNITTLKPFDKVLVRDNDEQMWTTDLFSHIMSNTNPNLKTTFVCVGHYPDQCIPFEGNEHLLGKTDDCDEYYKTWE